MAQVSWGRPLALAVTLAILGTFAYWLEYNHKPKQEAHDEQAKKIFPLKEKVISSIRIVDQSKSFTFKCLDLESKLCKPGDNSKWEVVEPAQFKADDTNVNSLVSSLNNLSVSEKIDLKEETSEKRSKLLKEYHLDPDSRKDSHFKRIEVMLPQNNKLIAYFGETHPIGDSVFTLVEQGGKIDENQVYLVPTYFKNNFDQNLTHWRDKKLITLASHDIASFTLKGSKSTFRADRKDSQWTIHPLLQKGPSEEFTGDIENIDNFLSTVSYLTAKEFISDHKSDSKAQQALKGTPIVLTFSLKKEKGDAKEESLPIIVTLYQRKGKPGITPSPKLLATVSNLDPLFELDPSTPNRLDKEFKDFRLTKLITSMERFTAKRLEFAGKPLGDKPLLLKNTDSKWIIESDGKVEAEPEKIQNLLDKFSGNRIKEFLRGSSVPAGEETGIRITLGDEKSDAKRQFVFWSHGDKFYASDLLNRNKKGIQKEAFLVDNILKDALPWVRNFFNRSTPSQVKK